MVSGRVRQSILVLVEMEVPVVGQPALEMTSFKDGMDDVIIPDDMHMILMVVPNDIKVSSSQVQAYPDQFNGGVLYGSINGRLLANTYILDLIQTPDYTDLRQ